MIRPCFLIIDPEHAGSISTRKLLIESAKFNVITAYSASEAIETVHKFGAVDAVVADAGMRDMDTPDLIRAIKKIAPEMTGVVVGSPDAPRCDEADYEVEPYEPRKLLELLQQLQPEKAAAVTQQEQQLEAKE